MSSNDLSLLKTDSDHKDFHQLIRLLDTYLWSLYGEKQAFYTQFNKVDSIRHVVIAYLDDKPVGCGSFKEFNENTVEIKRMFLVESLRGTGIASKILEELEDWAKELDYTFAVLETAVKQPRSIQFYTNSGFQRIDNYGQYIGVENSICFKKELWINEK